MSTVKLKDLDPVQLNGKLGLSTSSPNEKIDVNNGNIQLTHSNAGQGIKFKSTSPTGNKCSLTWLDNSGRELWRMILDEEGDNRNYLKFIANGNSVPTLELRDDGSIIMSNLPTTEPSVTGTIWNDSGTLKIKT